MKALPDGKRAPLTPEILTLAADIRGTLRLLLKTFAAAVDEMQEAIDRYTSDRPKVASPAYLATPWLTEDDKRAAIEVDFCVGDAES